MGGAGSPSRGMKHSGFPAILTRRGFTALAALTISSLASPALGDEHRQFPKLIAHRGASHAAPENSVAAFKLAWDEGADGVEADFSLTADGEVVAMHDADTLRTSGVKLQVAETPWAELAKLDIGTWKGEEYRGERIPRLADLLAEVPPGKIFFIEVKSGPETVAPIREVLMQHRDRIDFENIYLIAFSEQVVAAARQQIPEIRSHWLSNLKAKTGENDAQPDSFAERLQRSNAQGLQFQFGPDHDISWLETFRKPGFEVACWTIDHAQDARIAIEQFQPDFITTNRPAGLRAEVLEALNRNTK